jgi:hypothetical protein
MLPRYPKSTSLTEYAFGAQANSGWAQASAVPASVRLLFWKVTETDQRLPLG